jgi:hypothetical protein
MFAHFAAMSALVVSECVVIVANCVVIVANWAVIVANCADIVSNWADTQVCPYMGTPDTHDGVAT